MALWGKTDTEDDKPKWLDDADKAETELVEEAEAMAEDQQLKGIKTPGWNQYQTYTSNDGVVRHRSESLVAMNSMTTPIAPLVVAKKKKSKAEKNSI